ncbi:MAG: hypothetical protein J7J70_07950, partial [Deltaproteobacteria bacterium]|nr:hypothetical protein [Candidatus Tharpellaceae bacterium]
PLFPSTRIEIGPSRQFVALGGCPRIAIFSQPEAYVQYSKDELGGKGIFGQPPRPHMVRVNIDELGPYPAAFLGDDLMERFVRTTTFLAIDYLADGAHEDARKCLKNVSLAMETEKSPRNGFQDLLHLQKLWGQIHKAIADSENHQIQELMLE